MKKMKTVIAVVTCITFLQLSTFCYAQTEVEALIDLLVSKGVLSHGEAAQLMSEAEQIVTMQQVGAIQNGPEWLAKTTFKGDIRIRHQYENKEIDSKEPKHRWRTRFRWGFTNDMNDSYVIW